MAYLKLNLNGQSSISLDYKETNLRRSREIEIIIKDAQKNIYHEGHTKIYIL